MGDPVAQVHQGGQQPVEEHQPVPGTGPDRRWRGRSASLASWRGCQREPSSATSSARSCGDSPVPRAIGDSGGTSQAH
jgi:hypothetical protein